MEEVCGARIKYIQEMNALEKEKSEEHLKLAREESELKKEALRCKIAAYKAKESYYEQKKLNLCKLLK